jgi:hypothetical protein
MFKLLNACAVFGTAYVSSPLPHSLTHLLTYSLTSCLTRLLTHSLTHPLVLLQGAVQHLTSADFDSKVDGSTAALVEFYAPWW